VNRRRSRWRDVRRIFELSLDLFAACFSVAMRALARFKLTSVELLNGVVGYVAGHLTRTLRCAARGLNVALHMTFNPCACSLQAHEGRADEKCGAVEWRGRVNVEGHSTRTLRYAARGLKAVLHRDS
jgi:hypothetical protein